MIRVELPGHLRALAHVKNEVAVDVAGTVSVLSVIGRAGGSVSDVARDDSGSRNATATPISAILCMRRRFDARAGGPAIARGSGKRQGATVGGRSNRGRLAVQLRFETFCNFHRTANSGVSEGN